MTSDIFTGNNTKIEVNGSDVYTEEGVGNSLAALFTMLVRNGHYNIKKTLAKMEITDVNGKDLFVMAFQTRDIRGGKGERELFIHMILELFIYYPAKMNAMIQLVPEYGCWKDLWSMWTLAGLYSDGAWVSKVRTCIDSFVCEQFRKDWVALDIYGSSATLSLLAKWLPREDGLNDFISLHLAQCLFPSTLNLDNQRREYRKACSEMNAHLKTVEINMCGGKWSDIEPGRVPGRIMYRNKMAFLNLPPNMIYLKRHTIQQNSKKMHIPGQFIQSKDINNIRYPYSKDRMACRENFLNHIEMAKNRKAVMKGTNVIMPHDDMRILLDAPRYDKVRDAYAIA